MTLHFRAIVGAAGGGVYGAALARGLFEGWPATWSALGGWPGCLLMAGLGAAVVSGLMLKAAPARARWAPLALGVAGIALAAPDVNPLRSLVVLLGAAALFGVSWLGSPARSANWAPGLALFGLVLALYLRTLAPAVGTADPFEFQVSVARLGIAHGNGYPLLILVGRLFDGLPLGGTSAWRVNVAAATATALGAAGVVLIARRLGAGTRPAFLAALAFGVAPSVWLRTNEIQSNALDAALLTAALGLGLALLTQPAGPGALYALAFVFGLSLTNHLTAAVLAPALALAGGLWLWRRWRARASVGRPLAVAALCFALGLAVLVYLPLRWPAVGGGEPLTWDKFLYFVKGGEAAAQFDALLPLKEPQRFAYVFRKLLNEFTPAGFALTGLGSAALIFGLTPKAAVPARWAGVFLGLAAAGHLYFVLAYNPPEPDYSKFFIPLYVIMAVLIALGLEALLSLARARPETLRADFLSAFVPAAFLVIPLSAIWMGLPRVDLSAQWGSYRFGEYVLRQPLAAHATVLADPPHFAGPYYWQAAEGARPDLDIQVLPDEAAYRDVLDQRLAAGQPLYLMRYLAGLGGAYSLRSVGPLAEVAAQPFTAPLAIAQPLTATLTDGVQLIGYRLEPPAFAPPALPLTLFWHVAQTPDAALEVSLRLRDSSGRIIWQSAGRAPVNNLYPTNAWRPGEFLSDFYTVPLAETLAPGIYALDVGLFPPFKVTGEGWAEVAPVTVPAPQTPPAPAHPLRARFGADASAQWLLGYNAPETALPGATVQVTLYWQHGPNTTVTAFGETRSLTAWPEGWLVPEVYTLKAPASGEAFQLSVETGQTAQCGWLQPMVSACALPPIRLAGAALPADAVNFADQLVLRRAQLQTQTATRGDVVHVALEWQGLRALTESYTVFVHLVGPDGALHGQKDYWPVEGTRLTNTWAPGEIISDPYTVPVPYDAPPGAYTVHVGMYLLDTLERLPVLNADGAAIDDKVVLTGLIVK